jgi:RecJ-like exonuclease
VRDKTTILESDLLRLANRYEEMRIGASTADKSDTTTKTAVSGPICCPRCAGTGSVISGGSKGRCNSCTGAGRVWVTSDGKMHNVID